MRHLGKNVVIVLALVAAGFLAAWLRFRPYLGSESHYTDGATTYDVTRPGTVRYAVWDEPRPLGGSVNGPEDERHATYSPDGRSVVFCVGERGLGADLWIADLVDGEAVDARPLAALNTSADEWAPSFSADALWFASDRPGTEGRLDLYRAPWRDGVPGPVEHLSGGLNSAADDTDPAVVPGTDGLVFASDRAHEWSSDFDLYHARPRPAATGEEGSGDARPGWTVERVDALCTRFDEREPAFAADGLALFFASDRGGDFDLYRSSLGTAGWVEPRPLVGVNSRLAERAPSPSPDGFELTFAVEDPERGADLYRARSIELFQMPGRPVGWRELLLLALLLLVAVLAWLAKQWDQLEVLYKCLLVSLVAHLLLMLWLREVYPESGEYDLSGDSNRIRVRLVVPERGPLARNTERAGELESEREALAAPAPEHRASAEPVPAPSRPELLALERAAVEARTVPDARRAELDRSAVAPVPTDVHRDASEHERLAAVAPDLALGAPAQAAPATEETASPERRATRAQSAPASPEVARQDRSRADTGEAPAPLPLAAAAAEARSADDAREVPVEVAAPREALERHAAPSPALALAEPGVAALERGLPEASRGSAERALETGAPRPERVSQERARAHVDVEGAAPAREQARLAPPAAPVGSEALVAVAAPSEALDRQQAERPGLALEAVPELPRGTRREEDPGRRANALPTPGLDAPAPAGAELERGARADRLAAATTQAGAAASAPSAAPAPEVSLRAAADERFERLSEGRAPESSWLEGLAAADPMQRAAPPAAGAPARGVPSPSPAPERAPAPSAGRPLELAGAGSERGEGEAFAPATVDPSPRGATPVEVALPAAPAPSARPGAVAEDADPTREWESGVERVLGESLLAVAAPARSPREPSASSGPWRDRGRAPARVPALPSASSGSLARPTPALEDAPVRAATDAAAVASGHAAAPEVDLRSIDEPRPRPGSEVSPEPGEPARAWNSGVERVLADSLVALETPVRAERSGTRGGPERHAATAPAREDVLTLGAAASAPTALARREALALPDTAAARGVAPSARSEPRSVALRAADETTVPARASASPESGVERDLTDGLLALEAPTSRAPERAVELAPPRRAAAPEAWAADAPRFRPLEAASPRERDEGRVLPRQERVEHSPYRSRTGEEKLRALELHGGSKETERAVAAGLDYLRRIQSSQGYWGSPEDVHEKYGHVAVGKTGLAMLAFMGAGHTQDSGTEYSPVVAKAIEFLLAVQDDASGHFGYTTSYGHGIATYALAECYALTGDRRLARSLERAVGHILERQERREDPRYFGGWGYYYPDDRVFDPWPRTSITAWQVMALESARLAGLEVPDRAFDDAHEFLRRAWDGRRGAYRYCHDPERLGSGYPVLPGSTPAALFALSLLGDDTAGGDFGAARTFLLERLPEEFRYEGDDEFIFRAQGNLYFWYYATLALFRVGGEDWERWNEALKATLLPAQERDGSWRPISIYARYAGDDDGDRSYTTAMCVLTLEVYYRYFTPLLQVRPTQGGSGRGPR